MDDIVTDLRNRAKHCKEDLERDVEAFVLRQAADEIERLRTELESCNHDFDALTQIFNKVRTERDNWKKVAKERNPHSWMNLVRRKYGMEDMYER